MQIFLGIVSAAFLIGTAMAQNTPPSPQADQRQGTDSSHSTGRTEVPEDSGHKQPQGTTGPTNTTSGGAPAHSPQGQTPPGMQSAPEGSSKTIVDDKQK